MDNLQSVNVNEIPDGFSATDPTGSAQPGASDAQTAKRQEQKAQKESILEQVLTPEALTRLRRIKLVKSEKVEKIESMIVSMAMQKKLPGKINEGKLIEMLEGIGAKKPESTINTERSGVSSRVAASEQSCPKVYEEII